MTFSPEEYHFWYKEYPMFILWAVKKGILFLPKEVSGQEEYEQWDLTSKAYILMKRLGQDYNTIMLMDADERDKLFKMEMDLIKEEKKKKEKQNQK